MSEAPAVSNELKSMVDGSTPSVAAPDNSAANKLMALMSAAMVVVVVCMSITVANFNAATDIDTVKVSKVVIEEVKAAEMLAAAVPIQLKGTNVCHKTKVELPNIKCFEEIVGTIDDEALDFVNGTRYALGTAEQSGANVTKGYNGGYDTDQVPMTNPYYMEGMCAVNVHWHLGAEHLSVGEYDENGKGPKTDAKTHQRKLASEVILGNRCHHYDETDSRFTREYDWQHCVDMHVGETYEVHWPHSNMGDCGTPHQYQTPFYDGVFCNFANPATFNGDLSKAKIGVQGQVFTIINDESYYYPDLINGMIVDGDMGTKVTKYTGSTTGTSRDNEMCSQYTGITWQVDRKCHLISASSFDKMCADMKNKLDDMSEDLHAHGSRAVVNHQLAADNYVHKRR